MLLIIFPSIIFDLQTKRVPSISKYSQMKIFKLFYWSFSRTFEFLSYLLLPTSHQKQKSQHITSIPIIHETTCLYENYLL